VTLCGSPATPEYTFLFDCCRAGGKSGSEGLTNQSLGYLDWASVLAGARFHGILPLVYLHLSQSSAAPVPARIFSAICDAWRAGAARNMHLAAELIRIIDALQADGIRAVPFKGPTLAALAYGKLSLRESWDLDIFVEQNRVWDARDTLARCGYLASLPADSRDHSLLRTGKDITLVHSKTGVPIELHWAFTSPEFSCHFDNQMVWRRVGVIDFAGRSIAAFHVEDLALILSIHGARHCWDQLKWIADLAALSAAHPEINWHRVVKQAEAIGCRRILFVALLLLHDVLNAPIPETVLARARRDGTATALAADAVRLICENRTLGMSEEYVFQLRIRERARDRVSVFLAFVRGRLRPASCCAGPRWLYPFFWLRQSLIRLLHLTGTYGFSPLKSVLKAFAGTRP
jgi:Uncharacterised nucleotidyltransferase